MSRAGNSHSVALYTWCKKICVVSPWHFQFDVTQAQALRRKEQFSFSKSQIHKNKSHQSQSEFCKGDEGPLFTYLNTWELIRVDHGHIEAAWRAWESTAALKLISAMSPRCCSIMPGAENSSCDNRLKGTDCDRRKFSCCSTRSRVNSLGFWAVWIWENSLKKKLTAGFILPPRLMNVHRWNILGSNLLYTCSEHFVTKLSDGQEKCEIKIFMCHKWAHKVFVSQIKSEWKLDDIIVADFS